MSLPSIRKSCGYNNGCKQIAVTNCEGCSEAFCIKHIIDHRRQLDEQMNIIMNEYDDLKSTLHQQSSKSDMEIFRKEIDDWEKESIAKIQQRANELRQEIFQLITTRKNDLSNQLERLSEKLKESREENNFIEADLQLWKTTLDRLKTNFTSPIMISINPQNDVSLIQNISINFCVIATDAFHRVSDNRVQIKNNGQIAVRDTSQDCTEIRGRNEYEQGCHEIRLCIDQSTGTWIFLGINSKTIPLKRRSHKNESVYGWSSNGYEWSNGTFESEINNSNVAIEMKTNDIITLIFDCNNRQISMINERTKARHELTIDINSCPFPWQLHVILYEPYSRVRIL